MTELEERIHAIEDRTQIVELTARYCHMARTGNVEGIVDLFCEDGVMEANETPVEGHEKLLGGTARRLRVCTRSPACTITR